MSILTDDAKAILLLTAYFGRSDSRAAKPLAPKEWGRFAEWLRQQSASPRELLGNGGAGLLDALSDRRFTRGRIESLLARGAAMGLALDKWQRAGLWVMTRSDADYPRALKSRLREASPPVLFGCGARELLASGGTAIVGSRNADDEALAMTRELAKTAVHEGVVVVSGGARGVDEAAMSAALDEGGSCVGVLADNLLRAVSSIRYRRALRDGQLVLVSPFQPEARFLAGNAMARNKYIYCLSDAAIVIATGHGSGGTWSGAIENVKKGWVPLFVRRGLSLEPGREALVESGARWLPENPVSMRALVIGAEQSRESNGPDAAGIPAGTEKARTEAEGCAGVPMMEPSAVGEPDHQRSERAAIGASEAPGEHGPQLAGYSFYRVFLAHLRSHRGRLVEARRLAEQLDLPKPLVDRWLKQALAEGVVVKKRRPIRFEVIESSRQQQTSLF